MVNKSMERGGKRSATPLWISPESDTEIQCALSSLLEQWQNATTND
jgi:hypothetical protein